MEETKEAVNTAESAPADVAKEVVNEAQPTEGQTTTQPVTETATPPQGQASYPAVDEYGVPLINRVSEWKRKYEDTIERLPSMIEDTVKNSFQQYGQPAQKEYTIAELETFAMQNPEHRPWVEEQKALVLEQKVANQVEQRVKAVEQKQQGDACRQQAFNYVSSTYPEMFVKNPQGQIVGMNNQNAMFTQVDALMRDPRFSNDPEGLMAAADIAYARVSRQQQGISQTEKSKLQAEVKHLQKQTMIEGGGKSNVQSVPEYRKAIDKAKQSGNLKDVARALSEMAKAKKAAMEK